MSTEALITVGKQSEQVMINNNYFDMTDSDSMPGELHINCEDCRFSGMSFHGYKVFVNGKRVVVDSSYFDACKDEKPTALKMFVEPYHTTIKETQYMISTTDWIIIVMLIIIVPKLSWKLLVKPIKGQWNKVRASWKDAE